ILAMSPWLWVILAVVVVVFGVVRRFYTRFRGMCRGVREELSAYLPKVHPQLEVIGEQQGNLVVRMEDGTERAWEMADVYAAVARLSGMGADPQARAAIYQQAVDALVQSGSAAAGPLALATHGASIRPQLVRPESLAPDADVVRTPVPALGLVVIY